MWLAYALIAAVAFGVGQIFIKKGFKRVSALFYNVYSTILGVLIMIPFALVHGIHYEKIPSIVPLALIAAFLFVIYYYVIGKGQLSLTGTVVGTYPLVTVILSLLFLHETPSLFQKLAIFLTIFGTVFVAIPKKISDVKKLKSSDWLWRALFAVCAIGTADFLVKVLINQSDLYTYFFTYSLCSLIIIGLLWIFDKKGRALPRFSFKTYRSTLIGATLIEIGFIVFNLAVANGFISLVSPISSIYVGITAVLAWIFLKEKLSKIQTVGVILSVVGIILIGVV